MKKINYPIQDYSKGYNHWTTEFDYPKTENSTSLYFDLERLKKMNLKYFDLDVLKNDKNWNLVNHYCPIKVINARKNNGKTTWIKNDIQRQIDKIVKSLEKGEEPEDKFVLLLRTKAFADNYCGEINAEKTFPFHVKNGILFKNDESTKDWTDPYANIQVGSLLTLSTLHNHSSRQFPNYKNVYFDEYRSKVKLSANQVLNEPKAFITFTDNFQRGKNPNDLNIYLFGNNEPGSDPITESWGISKLDEYFIDLWIGVAYFNLSDIFQGLPTEDRIASRLSIKTKSLNDFLHSNIAMDSTKGLIPVSEFNEQKSILWRFFLFEGQFYKLSLNFQRDTIFVEAIEESEADIHIFDWNNPEQIECNALLKSDLMYNKALWPLDEEDYEEIGEYFTRDRMKFWRLSDRDRFTRLWTVYFGGKILDE